MLFLLAIYSNINWKSNWKSNYTLWYLPNYSNSLSILSVDGTIEQRKAIISLFVPFCCFFLCRPEPRTLRSGLSEPGGDRGGGTCPLPPSPLGVPMIIGHRAYIERNRPLHFFRQIAEGRGMYYAVMSEPGVSGGPLAPSQKKICQISSPYSNRGG